MSTIKANRIENLTTTDGGISINNSGNVSIGTTSPSTKLHVEGSENTLLHVESTDAFSGITMADTGGSVQMQTSSGYLRFLTGGDAGTTAVNSSESMRITSAGNVGIGTTSPTDKLTISSGSNQIGLDTGDQTNYGTLDLGHFANGAFIGTVAGTNSASDLLRLGTSGTERMRIHSGGQVTVGTTSLNPGINNTITGASINGDGYITASRNNPVAYFSRTSSDGTVVVFQQAGTTEGTISVSGSTVSYNGGHLSRWSQLAGGAERAEILRGSVLSNLDEMCEWGEEDNEQLNRMKVSDVEGDVNVSGVFQAWDDDDDTYTNDFYCAMTGDFVIRIAQGTTVARGDLLMSAGDGTAKPQGDDIVRSKTIAKVTSTTVSNTYPDGSYCVPCVLMAC